MRLMHSTVYDGVFAGVFARWLYLLILVSHHCMIWAWQWEANVIGAALMTCPGVFLQPTFWLSYADSP